MKYVKFEGNEIILMTGSQTHSDVKMIFGKHCKVVSAGKCTIYPYESPEVQVSCSDRSVTLGVLSAEGDSDLVKNGLRDIQFFIFKNDEVLLLINCKLSKGEAQKVYYNDIIATGHCSIITGADDNIKVLCSDINSIENGDVVENRIKIYCGLNNPYM